MEGGGRKRGKIKSEGGKGEERKGGVGKGKDKK